MTEFYISRLSLSQIAEIDNTTYLEKDKLYDFIILDEGKYNAYRILPVLNLLFIYVVEGSDTYQIFDLSIFTGMFESFDKFKEVYELTKSSNNADQH